MQDIRPCVLSDIIILHRLKLKAQSSTLSLKMAEVRQEAYIGRGQLCMETQQRLGIRRHAACAISVVHLGTQST